MYGTQRPIFPQNGSIYHFSTCKNMAWTTDYGRMMAISQILFGQYHTWVRSEKHSFFVEKTTEWWKSRTRDPVPKWGLIFCLEIPKIPPNLFCRSAQLAQKFRMSLKKGLHWVSVVRGLNGASSVLLHLIIRGSNDAEENFSELNFIRKNGISLNHSSTTVYVHSVFS